jgi:hypothetical protein
VVVLGAAGHGVSKDVVHAARNPCRQTFGLKDEDNIGYNAPRVMVDHARQLLQRSINATALFNLGAELAWVVKRVKQGQYILGVQNPEAREAVLDIKSRIGVIVKMDEIMTDQSVNASTTGWAPAGYEHLSLGRNSNATIAGLDMRIFRVYVNERPEATQPVAPLQRSDYTSGVVATRLLRLGHGMVGNLEHWIMTKPSFKTRFRGVVIDSAFLHSRTMDEINIVGEWMAQNNLTVAVDFSRVINVFPYPPRSFRLYKYMPAEYNASMRMFLDVIGKLPAIGAKDMIMTLHRKPPTTPNVFADMEDTVKMICAAAKQNAGATVHLRQAPKNDDYLGASASADAGQTLLAWAEKLGQDNLRVALQTGLLLKNNHTAAEAAALYNHSSSSSSSSSSSKAKAAATFLLVSGYNDGVNAKRADDFDQASVSGMPNAADRAALREMASAAAAAGATLVHDAAFASWGEALDDVAATTTTRRLAAA